MILLLYTDGKNSILHKTFNVYVLMKLYTRFRPGSGPGFAGMTISGLFRLFTTSSHDDRPFDRLNDFFGVVDELNDIQIFG